MDKMDLKEKIWGGVFGIIAILAAILEMFVSGISASSVLGMIKDVTGTLVVIILFIAVIKTMLPKKNLDLKQTVSFRMETIKEKYTPLLQEDEKKAGVIRYNIASNIESLFVEAPKGYKRLFELDENNPNNIRFYVNKSFFSKSGEEAFDATDISKTILPKLQKKYNEYKISIFKNGDNSGILVDFDKEITTKDDIDSLMNLIDYTVLLYIAENKS